MPRDYKPRGLRAPKGSVEVALRVRISAALEESIRQRAREEGLTVSQWCRIALLDRARNHRSPR